MSNEKSDRAATMVAATGFTELMNPAPGLRMPMKGFDPQFVDIADYIVRITSFIWDEKDPERCRDYYTEDCVVHTLAGDIDGVATVIDNTRNTLVSFPDRTLDAENVIWSGNDTDGFYSSHLIISEMTNDGESEFGPATGRKVRIRTIADCLVADNKVYGEWLARDNLGLVRQLGLDPHPIAQAQARSDRDSGDKLSQIHAAEIGRVFASNVPAEPRLPDRPEDEPEAFARAAMAAIWKAGDLSQLQQVYDYRASFHGPDGRELYGPHGVSSYIRQFRDMFPDLRVTVDHVCDVPYLGGARDIAVRWSLAGTHTGDGIYGLPTGKPIRILGMTQWRVIGGQIHEDWTVFDELAILRQVERARLDD